MFENRCFSCDVNVRDSDSGGDFVIEGYFALFDEQTELFNNYFEKIDRGAFGDLGGCDVKALLNHDSSVVLGRTANDTLRLSVDDKGLFGSIVINKDDSEAMNVYQRVKRGDISQCSFGFRIDDEEHDWDGDKLFSTLKRVTLFEVSVVTFPAYDKTCVSARSRFDRFYKDKLDIKKNNLRGLLNNGFKNFNK